MIVNIFVFILGAIVGSFLNVCIHRLPEGESIIMPGSHCTNCIKPLKWHDNIPILSYLALGGRCRFCSSKIPFRYFLVELLTAALALGLFLSFGFTAKFFAYSILVSGLIIATFVDFEIQEIPDQVTLVGIALGLVMAAVFPSILGRDSRIYGLLDSLLGMLVGGGSIYAMGFFGELVFKREAMGGGDVKLLAMIGAFMGIKLVVLTFFIAPVFGSMVGLILKIRDGRDIIPYGPYLSLAALVSIFWGESILGLLSHGLF